MAGPNEANTETVPVATPPATPKPAEQNEKQTPRMQFPAGERLTKPPAAPVLPAPQPTVLAPKKETLRIPPATDSMQSAAQAKDNHSFTETPAAALQNSSAALAPPRTSSMLLWWILLAASALILIIQIWTYFL